MDGHVDLLDDVNEQPAVDALGESVPDVTTLVGVKGGNLGKQRRHKSVSVAVVVVVVYE